MSDYIRKAIRYSKTAQERINQVRRLHEEAQDRIQRARNMKLAGYSNVEIARQLGINEAFVRRILSKDEPSQENRPL